MLPKLSISASQLIMDKLNLFELKYAKLNYALLNLI